MIIEFVIIFEVALLILLAIAYKQRDEILWASTIVLAGVMVFISSNIQFHSFITNQFVMASYQSSELQIINLAILLISLIYLFIDIISNHWSILQRVNIWKDKDAKATKTK